MNRTVPPAPCRHGTAPARSRCASACRPSGPRPPRRPAILALIALIALLAAGPAALLAAQDSPDPAALLAKLDAAQTYQNSQGRAAMTITDQLGTRTSEFRMWSRGKDDTFMEFTSPAEKGQKILRNAKELYLFFPDAEEITRLQGAALRQSMAGSDISYEDMTGNRNRGANYSASLAGADSIDGRAVWLLKLTARTRNVAYARQEVWMDQATSLPVRIRFYDLSGRQLKEIAFSGVQTIDGIPCNTRLLVKDSLKAKTSTELRLMDLVLNKAIPASVFSLDNLKW